MRIQRSAMTVCALAMALFAGTAMAGQKNAVPGDGPGAKIMDAFNKALATVVLDDTQSASTKQILGDAEGQLAAIRDKIKSSADKKTAREDAKGEFVKILKGTRDKIDGVLNQDQQKTFDDALKAARQEMKQERDANPPEHKGKGGKNGPSTQPAGA